MVAGGAAHTRRGASFIAADDPVAARLVVGELAALLPKWRVSVGVVSAVERMRRMARQARRNSSLFPIARRAKEIVSILVG